MKKQALKVIFCGFNIDIIFGLHRTNIYSWLYFKLSSKIAVLIYRFIQNFG
jgi:hypothetical protein